MGSLGSRVLRRKAGLPRGEAAAAGKGGKRKRSGAEGPGDSDSDGEAEREERLLHLRGRRSGGRLREGRRGCWGSSGAGQRGWGDAGPGCGSSSEGTLEGPARPPGGARRAGRSGAGGGRCRGQASEGAPPAQGVAVGRSGKAAAGGEVVLAGGTRQSGWAGLDESPPRA